MNPATSFVRALFVSLALSLALVGPLWSGILLGPVTNPANGHSYYLLTQNTWTASEAEAVALGGFEVTLPAQMPDPAATVVVLILTEP